MIKYIRLISLDAIIIILEYIGIVLKDLFLQLGLKNGRVPFFSYLICEKNEERKIKGKMAGDQGFDYREHYLRYLIHFSE